MTIITEQTIPSLFHPIARFQQARIDGSMELLMKELPGHEKAYLAGYIQNIPLSERYDVITRGPQLLWSSPMNAAQRVNLLNGIRNIPAIERTDVMNQAFRIVRATSYGPADQQLLDALCARKDRSGVTDGILSSLRDSSRLKVLDHIDNCVPSQRATNLEKLFQSIKITNPKQSLVDLLTMIPSLPHTFVHELGHSSAFKAFGIASNITINFSEGGLTQPNCYGIDPLADSITAGSGPCAGALYCSLFLSIGAKLIKNTSPRMKIFGEILAYSAALNMVHELHYALSSTIYKDNGDFGNIRRNGLGHIIAAWIAFLGLIVPGIKSLKRLFM